MSAPSTSAPTVTCSAAPGWYCSPLSTLEQCPSNWYCPGGYSPARPCPDGQYSNAGSVYPQDCWDSSNVGLWVFVSLTVAVIVFIFCVFFCCDWWYYQYPVSYCCPDRRDCDDEDPRYACRGRRYVAVQVNPQVVTTYGRV